MYKFITPLRKRCACRLILVKSQGFSLLEVMIALSVLGVSLIGLLALGAPMLQRYSDSRKPTRTEIRQIIADRLKQIEFDTIDDHLSSNCVSYIVVHSTDKAVDYELHNDTLSLTNVWNSSNEDPEQQLTYFIRSKATLIESALSTTLNHRVVRIVIQIASAPDPAVNFNEYLLSLEEKAPEYSMRLVIHR